MPVLSTELRNKLERTVIEARDVAEEGARAALEALAVHHYEPYGHMSPEERQLRNHLRARARQLGDKQNKKGELEIIHLVWECAYEHWHRMLFARFLAENDLLIEPEMGVAISLAECEELAKEEGKDLWALASEFAQRMLPQIFRPDDPLLKVMFAREHRLKLERLLDSLETAVFTASESLGWVYQFWQSKRKKEVNESGNKIGGDELPAVTQLFTEPYMVNFLIHNTLGAWWACKVLAENPELAERAQSEEELRHLVGPQGVSWGYLRFIQTDNGKRPWHPAAGTFDSWPSKASELRVFDPSCGSGHFLVAAFYHLVSIRIAEENLPAKHAVDAVLSENLYGLEIDERCTQISAFSLAFAAWTYPDANGFRPLPDLNIACSGIGPNSGKEDWIALIGENDRLKSTMIGLYDLFRDAPTLGSLIDPALAIGRNLFEVDFEEIRPSLEKVLTEEAKDYEHWEMGIAARGIADAVRILANSYHLVITNVPYLASGKQTTKLKDYIELHYRHGKQNLATAFVERALNLCTPGGSIALVTPQNWHFLGSYTELRKELLKKTQWNYVARLGTKAFQTPMWDLNIMLFSLTNLLPPENHFFVGLDASECLDPKMKATILCGADKSNSERKNQEKSYSVQVVPQDEQLLNPDARIIFEAFDRSSLLSNFAFSYEGLTPGDISRYVRFFWEISKIDGPWAKFIGSAQVSTHYGGRERIIYWQDGVGDLRNDPSAYIKGKEAWGKMGLRISQMKELACTLYTGELFNKNAATFIPSNPSYLAAIYVYCWSEEFRRNVRKIDQALKVTVHTLVKVPFDLKYWEKVAERKYPKGLPTPYSENPTQWLFKGSVRPSETPLQVAVARLLGFRWPEQVLSGKIEEAIEAIVDEDGIVCVPSVRGEEAAAERLRSILATVYSDDWTPAKETELITTTGSSARSFDDWIGNDFFEQHCKLFHHRPLIWYIWDGRRRDGFHALLNYHKLAEGNGRGRQLLESLTYSYLGDWITRQKDGVRQGEGGAEDRLAAALELQKRLLAILEGEPPFDIFVRWKPIEEQPIGWEPDINDGVRINIRPFMAQDITGGRKGAGILRWKPNIKWNKDRGKEPHRPEEQYPWFWKDGEFTGDRVNDVHLSNAKKLRARDEGAA